MHKYKHHIKKQYKGVQIDLYQDKDATWFCFVPNRVHPTFRTDSFKLSQDAVRQAQDFIDKKPR
jgi:hypothetical protein